MYLINLITTITDMSTSDNYTVLVVDDEPIITELVSQWQCDRNNTVLIANCSAEALVIMQSQAIDVVISDICMDGMNGFDLLAEIALIDNTINVILMTAYDCHKMIRRAINAGAYDYLSKPLDELSVHSVIERAAQSTALTRQNIALIEQLTRNNEDILTANRKLIKLNNKLQLLSITDELTQLYNRRYIDEWLHAHESSTVDTNTCSVILLDIDHFKKVNDTFGHAGGDKVLQKLSHILLAHHRNNDLVGRYGGEEFVVILPDCSEDDAIRYAEELRERIEKTIINMRNGPISFTVSMGISSTKQTTPSYDATMSNIGRKLIDQADKALYRAKDNGRNQCVHYDRIERKNTNCRIAG